MWSGKSVRPASHDRFQEHSRCVTQRYQDEEKKISKAERKARREEWRASSPLWKFVKIVFWLGILWLVWQWVGFYLWMFVLGLAR